MNLRPEAPAPRIHPALHIDVVACGRRIAEETFDRRRKISVGRSRSNTIILPDEHAPRSLPLFRRNATGYSLHYTDGLKGAVARSAQAPPDDLSKLREASSASHGGYDLALEEGARGEIQVGDEKLAFELVAGVPPLVVPRRWWPLAALLAGVLLVGGVLAATLVPRPRAPLPEPMIAQSITPRSLSTVTVPKVPRSRELSIRSGARRHGQVELGGTRRVRGAFPIPKLGEVGSLPRGAERSIDGNSDYDDDGVLKPEAMVRALQRDEGALRAIYEHALRRSPAIEGDLVVRLLVNRDGSIGRVSIIEDKVPSVVVTRRVQLYLRDWHAPGPMAMPAEYELPLHFRAVKPRH